MDSMFENSLDGTSVGTSVVTTAAIVVECHGIELGGSVGNLDGEIVVKAAVGVLVFGLIVFVEGISIERPVLGNVVGGLVVGTGVRVSLVGVEVGEAVAGNGVSGVVVVIGLCVVCSNGDSVVGSVAMFNEPSRSANPFTRGIVAAMAPLSIA